MGVFVDVVIPVHNSVHWLSWCLEELLRFDSNKLRKIYVVDDRSEAAQANQVNEIVSRYKNVELIRNTNSDGGFGYACNLGAGRCASEIVLFLNTDCLITEGAIDRLCSVFELDQNIALACPVSNNSPDLTYPMFPGHSYRDMAARIANVTLHSEKDFIFEACTVVGNCLMVNREFFQNVGGFSAEWGVGYGEETDLHMKALSCKMKGVVHVGCYVYHFGGGTFNYQAEIEEHRSRNYKLFMGKWEKEYKGLASRCSNNNPIKLLANAIDVKPKTIELDVLFYLPGIDQGIGGLNAVVAICNDLVRMGLKVSCALVGITADRGLKDYKEPVLFNFLYYVSDSEFLDDRAILPKVVFSTIFNSASVVAEYAAERGSIPVQFVQGYEGYFENGQRYVEACESYACTGHLVTTSAWLFEMVNRHLQPSQQIRRLPLVVNQDIFFTHQGARDIDVVLVFRSGADKGQWILADTLDRLIGNDLNILVLCAAPYKFLIAKYGHCVRFVDLPIDQYSIAKIFRRAKVYVDASLHEGYVLIPLEAALCGCQLVLTDSGGVRDFVGGYGGVFVSGSPDSKNIVDAVHHSLSTFSADRNNDTTERELLMAGASWYQYVQDISRNHPSPSFRNSKKRVDIPMTVRKATSSRKGFFYGLLSKIYRRLFPYIPLRLHMALKVLVHGKL